MIHELLHVSPDHLSYLATCPTYLSGTTLQAFLSIIGWSKRKMLTKNIETAYLDIMTFRNHLHLPCNKINLLGVAMHQHCCLAATSSNQQRKPQVRTHDTHILTCCFQSRTRDCQWLILQASFICVSNTCLLGPLLNSMFLQRHTKNKRKTSAPLG